MSRPGLPTWQRTLLVTASVAATIAALYFARAVLIPFVVASLLAFILGPLVSRLQHWGLGRVPASLAAVIVACLIVAVVGVMVLGQVEGLASDIPNHKEVIIQKIVALKEASRGSWPEGLYDMLNEIVERVNGPAPGNPPRELVVAASQSASYWQIFLASVAPLLDFAIHLGLVLVLVLFMLIYREDLRNRLIRLSGARHLATMTRALDDASSRISHFLLMQLVINAVFGAAAGLGLFVIGVPYAFLWGFLAGLLRYIPYLGVWIAAALPAILSLIFPDWQPLLLVLGLFLALEIVVANFVEPYLYGRSIGVSAIALITAAVFWAWLWGPLGLLLCTPLTACLVVVGRYIPHFHFLQVLLGDEPALGREVSFYQRLLARDLDEAGDIVERALEEHPPERVYDDLLLAALVLAKGDREGGELGRRELRYVCQRIYDLATEVVGPQLHGDQKEKGAGAEKLDGSDGRGEPARRLVVLGCPATDETEHVALFLLAQLLDHGDCAFELVRPRAPLADIAARIRADDVRAVCVMSLPPGGLTQTRALCRRLRRQSQNLRICVAWCGRDVGPARDRLAGDADDVVPTLLEARNRLREALAAPDPSRKEMSEAAAG
jgi:predicted PurR-regulated permease PerM